MRAYRLWQYETSWQIQTANNHRRRKGRHGGELGICPLRIFVKKNKTKRQLLKNNEIYQTFIITIIIIIIILSTIRSSEICYKYYKIEFIVTCLARLLPHYNAAIPVTFTARKQTLFHHLGWRGKISCIIHHIQMNKMKLKNDQLWQCLNEKLPTALKVIMW